MTAVVSRRQGSSSDDKAENGLAASHSPLPHSPSNKHHHGHNQNHSHGRHRTGGGSSSAVSSKAAAAAADTPSWVYASFVLCSVVTIVFFPRPFQPPHGTEPTLQHVFYYGWLTALSTGLGALPFCLVPKIASYWVGVSNGTF
jgi:hypothetical protein